MTETLWPTKLKLFTIWPCTEKTCWSKKGWTKKILKEMGGKEKERGLSLRQGYGLNRQSSFPNREKGLGNRMDSELVTRGPDWMVWSNEDELDELRVGTSQRTVGIHTQMTGLDCGQSAITEGFWGESWQNRRFKEIQWGCSFSTVWAS